MYFLRALLIGLVCGSLAAAQAHSSPRATVDPTRGPTTNPLAALPFPPASPTAPALAVSTLEELDQLVAAQRDGLLHAAGDGRALVGSFARIAVASSDDHARHVTAEVLAKHGCSTEAVNQMPLLTGFEVSLAAAGLLATPTIELRSSHESSICAEARDAEAGLARGEIDEWNYAPIAVALGIAAPHVERLALDVADPAARLGHAVGIDAYLSGSRACAADSGASAGACILGVVTMVAFTTHPLSLFLVPASASGAGMLCGAAYASYKECVKGAETAGPSPAVDSPVDPPAPPSPIEPTSGTTPVTHSNDSPDEDQPTERNTDDGAAPDDGAEPKDTSKQDEVENEKATHGTCSSGASADPMRCDELRRAGFEAFQAALEEILKQCPLTEAERARLPEYDPRNFITEPACDEAAVARDLALLAGEAEAACPLYCQEQKAREEASNREREQRERMEACSRTTPTSDNPHDACATVRADLLAQATADPLAALRLGTDVGLGIAPTAPTDPSVSALAAARSAPEVVAAFEAAKRASE